MRAGGTRRSVTLDAVRAFVPTVVLTLACAVLVGCGGGGTPDGAPPAQADEQLAARIQASARRRAEEGKELRTQQEIDRLNAANTPTVEAEEPAAQDATPSPTAASSSPADGALLSAADRSSFDQLAARLGGSSGIAVKAAGSVGGTVAAGSLRSGVAWSTMKTGVAAATFAAGAAGGSTGGLLTRAITASDNAAAEQLWSALGPPDQAGALVGEQLRAAGDANTRVQTQRVRPGFTAFGQSEWALTDQVRFTAGMACTDPGRQVLELMGQVVAGQRWGLGAAGVPARLKGGWGPEASGGYLVRQMGILTVHDRPIAVTIATLPADGAFGTGTSHLTSIAEWFVSHVNYRAAPVAIRC